MRVRRVGTVTCGLILIAFGILFVLHMLVPSVTYTFIFRFWPFILILLGIEVLISNCKKGETIMKYDMGAVFLMILLVLFAMGMGVVEFTMLVCFN